MDEDEQQVRIRKPKAYKPRKDILNLYDDAELIERYRLDLEGIMLVTDMVRDAIAPPTNRSNSVSAELKVVTTLQYLATGKMLWCNHDELGLSQQTISRVISETLDALVTPAFVSRFITFPTWQADIQQKQAQFMEIGGFPGVVGAIDGTHIRLISPKEYEAEYVNHNNHHSINTQVVFDAKYRILDVVAKWPGSTHDDRIWSECSLKILFETGRIPAGCYLLGDSGYPGQRCLLTPYLQPHTVVQKAYNRAHQRTRRVVERGIDQWKRRFHVLHREARVSPQKLCKIIMACAGLHNLCKERNLDPAVKDEPVVDEVEQNDIGHDQPVEQQAGDGLRFRDYIANLHFNPEN